MSMIQDSQTIQTWNPIVFIQPQQQTVVAAAGNVIFPTESELRSSWQQQSASAGYFIQENLMTPSNLLLSNSVVNPPQNPNATGMMDAREIVVLEDPLDPNNLQHQTEIIQNVVYSEDVETGPDCSLSKKQPSELICVVPPPNKSPRLNSLGRNLLAHSQQITQQQSSFSMQTSNVTSTTSSPEIKATSHWGSENETNPFPDNLSAKNVKVNSGENLTCGTVYLLKGTDGVQFTAVWNGQHFKQFPEPNTLTMSNANGNNVISSSVQHMSGGGGGNTQTSRSTVLQGRGGLPVMTQRNTPSQEKVHIIYRTTARRPLSNKVDDKPKTELTPNSTPPCTTNSTPPRTTKVNVVSPSVQNSSSVSSSSTESTKKVVISASPKTLISKEDIVMMVCANCGISSRNLTKCDRCKKKIPENSKTVKYSHLKKEIYSVKKSNFTLEKRQFYSKNIADQVSGLSSPESLPKVTTVSSTDKVKPTQYSRVRIIPKKRSNLHSVKHQVPETVTISDDEEPPPASGESSENQSKPLDSSMQQQNSSLNNSTVAMANTSTAKSENLQEDDDDRCDSPLFPAISTNVTRDNSKSRCNRMEDEVDLLPRESFLLGNVVSRGSQQQMEVDDPDDGFPLQGDNSDPAFIPDRVLFYTRHLRIGNVDISTSRVITLTKECLSFDFPDDDIHFKVFPVEFQSVECSFAYHRPVLFLHLVPSCGGRIRAVLNITHDSKLYYDPDSTDITQRHIVMILEPSKKMVLIRRGTTDIFQSYQKLQSQIRGKDQEMFREITAEEANRRMTEICPQLQLSFPSSPESPYPSSPLDESMAMFQDPASPPHMGFTGPVENLMTYPPPPAKGGITITNEDFYCLNEREFLNDVIIDFFLKYLVLERISETDRKRTHVFSSFFYKRLTQRLNKHSQVHDLGVESTPMVKRHAQVKTWTRHVDIFEKDFIIVPINENAHWFLAIICFPGMEKPQTIRYVFVPNTDTTNNSNSNSSSTVQKKQLAVIQAETVSSSDDKNSVPVASATTPTTTPTKVPKNAATTPETKKIKINDLQKNNYTQIYGFKQPCILIFDSLAGPSRTSVVKALREYLQVEWDTRKKTPKRVFDKDFIKGGVPKVQQQNNYSDCGVYVLQYVESFFKSPIKDFTIPIRKLDWFTEEDVNSKRQEIQELIWNLKKETDVRNAANNKS